jgi:hypothetical protein
MPKFFFHVTHGGVIEPDEQGVDLPDDRTAWEEATRACGEMMVDIDGNLPAGTEWRMVVHDEKGPLFSVHFGAERLR